MNRIGAKNQWNHWTSDPPPSDAGRARSATTHSCRCPRIVPASQTRSHHDQRATSPPWHPGTLPIETPMLPTPVATPATRDDVPSLASGAGQAESPLGSRPSSLEHSSISSSTSTCLLECGRLCNPCCNLDRRTVQLRADAGALEQRRRTNIERQASAHDLPRDSARSGPAPSRTRRFGIK